MALGRWFKRRDKSETQQVEADVANDILHEEPEEAADEQEEAGKGFFAKLKDGLSRT